jgi:glycosyltransferase involved in cell wall biosynthesis
MIFIIPLSDQSSMEPSPYQSFLNNLPFISVVIIGRNEALNLPACIKSIQEMDYPNELLEVMYVDTDSDDGSPDVARDCGVLVVEEHSDFPSAGLARNRGWREVKNDIVHFVDGDMIVDPHYLQQAVQVLGKDGVSCVFGRVKEHNADHNLIARILEYPWAVRKPGFVDAPGAGGTFLRSALEEINGYNPELLCGEESDLGHRLRQKGHKILLIDQSMGTHDYQIHNLVDLWKWYETKGRSFTRILQLPPSASIAPEQQVARRALHQFLFTLCLSVGLSLMDLWWAFAFIPIALATYVVFRYWRQPRLRGLRIAYFMGEYFNKPAIWLGMVKQKIAGG